MSKANRIIAVALLVCAVGAVLAVKRRTSESAAVPEAVAPQRTAANEAAMLTREDSKREALPRLVDLGAGKCIPCRMMAPILEELKREFAGTFEVEFVDIGKSPEAGKPYGIRVIPTQIFYDAKDQELFRHEGFLGKEDILDTWKKYGVVASIPPVK